MCARSNERKENVSLPSSDIVKKFVATKRVQTELKQRLNGLRFIEELRSSRTWRTAHSDWEGSMGRGNKKVKPKIAERCSQPQKLFSSRLLLTSASLLCCCFAFRHRTVFDFGFESFFFFHSRPVAALLFTFLGWHRGVFLFFRGRKGLRVDGDYIYTQMWSDRH